MDGVKLSEIKGLMVNKKSSNYDKNSLTSGILVAVDNSYNEAITDQGSRSIGLDREILSFTIYKKRCGRRFIIEEHLKVIMEESYKMADAIIANEKEIIVFKGAE